MSDCSLVTVTVSDPRSGKFFCVIGANLLAGMTCDMLRSISKLRYKYFINLRWLIPLKIDTLKLLASIFYKLIDVICADVAVRLVLTGCQAVPTTTLVLVFVPRHCWSATHSPHTPHAPVWLPA
jgi:hypothetical protein